MQVAEGRKSDRGDLKTKIKDKLRFISHFSCKYKDVTGYGVFTAATYGTRCPAHEYGTTPKVECRIHAPGIEFHTWPL